MTFKGILYTKKKAVSIVQAGGQNGGEGRPKKILLKPRDNIFFCIFTASFKMTRSAYKCDFGAAEVDSSLGQIARLDHVVVVGVVEQRLGRDAADVEAGAAQRRVLLDANSLERKKRGYSFNRA